MITIATYRNLMSAELAKTRLEFHDIQAMIADECFYTLGYGAVMDGVRLQVLDADAERAKDILATEDFIDLPDDSTILAESPESAVFGAEAFKEPAQHAASSRFRGWPVLLLFLCGISCLILGRPAGDWSAMHILSGQLVLLGETLVVAGLWIAYGRLSAEGDHEPPLA